MKKIITTIVIVTLGMLFCGCGGHSSTPPIEQPTHETVYSSFAGADRVYGAPGLADPGTNAEVVDYNARTVVLENGSFTIDFSRNASSNQTSTTMIPPLFVVTYYNSGKLVEELIFEADYSPGSSVFPHLFSTGSGPNDMLLYGRYFYIANSMDNTVTRHNMVGDLLATAQFNEFASPSYLGFSEDGLLVTSNGENRLWSLDWLDLTGYDPNPTFNSWANLAFPGPGQPSHLANVTMVPYAMIETFSPTVYGDSVVSTEHDFMDVILPGLTPEGKNSQFAAVDEENQMYYVVSTGEIQFDEFWSPYPESDSYLTAFEGANLTGGGSGDSLNLGMIGAGRIAISPDGTTAFLGNSLNGNLYMIDLINMEVLRGEDNPIVLTTEYTFISDAVFTPDGQYVLATSFNTDELYVVDAVTGEVNPGPYPAPFDLSLDPELMAGAANVEIIETPQAYPGTVAYVLLGVANSVTRVHLY